MGDESAMSSVSEASGVSQSGQGAAAEGGSSRTLVLTVLVLVLVGAIVGSIFLLRGSGDKEVKEQTDDIIPAGGGSSGGGSSGGGASGGGSDGGGSDGGEPSSDSTPPATSSETTNATTTATTTTTTPEPFKVKCNSTLTADQQGGEFTSHNYPNNYKKWSYQSWCIRTAPGGCIKVEFLVFEVEELEGPGISVDTLTVYDGTSDQDTVLGKHYGMKLPKPITSSGNTMTLIFKIDGGIEEKGFKAKYSRVACTALLIASVTPRSLDLAGGVQSADWLLQAKEGRIYLGFDSFDLDDCCDCEYITVFDGDSTAAPVIGRYCGKQVPPPEITSTSNSAFVHFHSKKGAKSNGFSAKYMSV